MKISVGGSAANDRHFILLAPHGVTPPRAFRTVERDASLHKRLLFDMQRFRAQVYVQDRAINETQVDRDGRHAQLIDEDSWHLLVIGRDGYVMGCLRYRLHKGVPEFHHLSASSSAVGESHHWQERFKRAVDKDLDEARRNNLSIAEVGGWALDEELRFSSDALRTVLCTYAWSNAVGGCLGICTATVRNSSASILKRMGGRRLTWDGSEIPPYYDPKYGCEMELLRFDSRFPSAKYQYAIDELTVHLSRLPVISTAMRGISLSSE